MENRQETEINIIEYIFVLLRRWWIIFLVAVFCGSAMFAYTKLMVTPMYKSTAKLYVLPAKDDNKLTNSDAQMALSFTKDFQSIAVGRTVLEGVIDEFKLDMSYEELSGIVSSSSSEESRIITISVSHSDPANAQIIANAICVEAEKVLYDTVESDLINISEKANLPGAPYKPNLVKNAAIAAFGGVAVTCAVLFVMFVLDDKIKTPIDVETQLGISTLGIIPAHKLDEGSDGKGKKGVIGSINDSDGLGTLSIDNLIRSKDKRKEHK